MLLDLDHQLFFHILVGTLTTGRLEAQGSLVLDNTGADIGGQDQDTIAEIYTAPKAVCKLPFLHDLQKHVEHVMVRFFDFIKKDDRVRPAADLLGKLPTFLETNVAGRSAYQP